MRRNIVRHESMLVGYEPVNGWTVVDVDGDVDAHTAPMIREAVIELIDAGHRHFVLDLGCVTFMDSRGLGVIAAVTKRIREHGGSLRVASASGRILRIFDLSGMRDSYEIHDSALDATSAAPVPGGLVDWPRPAAS